MRLRKQSYAVVGYGAEFAEYDGDDNNTPLHSTVPDRQHLAAMAAAIF